MRSYRIAIAVSYAGIAALPPNTKAVISIVAVSRLLHARGMNKSICEAERLVALNALCESGRARKIRQASRLPLVVIARSVGAHESTIGRWERGERFPTPGATADAYLDLLRKLDKP